MKKVTEKNLVKACLAEWDLLDPNDNLRVNFEVEGDKSEQILLKAKCSGLRRVVMNGRIAGRLYKGYNEFSAKEVVKLLETAIENQLSSFCQAIGPKAEKLKLSYESSDEQLRKAINFVVTKKAVVRQTSISPRRFKAQLTDLENAIANIAVLKEINKIKSGFYANLK